MWLPAAIYNHNTENDREGRRFLLTRCPIWGSWVSPTLSHFLVQHTRLKAKFMPRDIPSFLSAPLAAWVGLHFSSFGLHLSHSGEHTCGARTYINSSQLSPSPEPRHTARPLQPVMQEAQSTVTWTSRAACALGTKEDSSHASVCCSQGERMGASLDLHCVGFLSPLPSGGSSLVCWVEISPCYPSNLARSPCCSIL